MKNNKGISLTDAVNGFLFSYQAEGKSNTTISYYGYLLRPLLAYAKEKNWQDDLSSLDTQRLREFLAWTATRKHELLVADKGGKTIRQANPKTSFPYYRTLRRFLNWAIEERYLKFNPLASIHFKPPASIPIEGYSREELQRLLAVCDLDIKTGAVFTGLRNKAMLFLFIDSGLRRAELVNLRLDDVSLEKKVSRVVGKGNKVGIAPFSVKTAKIIWSWTIERKKRAKTDHLWVTEEGNAFSASGLASWFERLKKRAGINNSGGVHRLRHTAALQYLRSAKDSFLLQLFLRHSSLEMSRRYTQGLKTEEAINAHHNGASPIEGLGLG